MATALTSLLTRFTDKCNKVLAGGVVKTYEPNSLTPKVSYQDPEGTIPNLPEVMLDETGRAKIYLLGDYRVQVYSNDGILIEDNLLVEQALVQRDFDSLSTDIQQQVGEALQTFENTGGFISAPTLTALQAITPEYDYQLARVDDTGDEYRWNPALTTTVKWEPTGRNFLSESKADATIKSLNAKASATFESRQFNNNAGTLSNTNSSLALRKIANITANSFQYLATESSVLALDNVAISASATTKQSIIARLNAVDKVLVSNLRSRETVINGTLSTYFSKQILIDSSKVDSVSASSANITRIWFKADMTPDSNFASPGSVQVYCTSIPSSTLSSISDAQTEDIVIIGHTGGFIGLYVKNSYVQSLGYSLTKESLTQFVKDRYSTALIEYFTNSLVTMSCSPAINVNTGDTVLLTSGAATATASVYAKQATVEQPKMPQSPELSKLSTVDILAVSGTKSINAASVLSLETLITSNNAVEKASLSVVQNNATVMSVELKAFERVEKNFLISTYKKVKLADIATQVSSATDSTNHVIINFPASSSPNSVGAFSGFSCYGTKLKSTTPSVGATDANLDYVAMHQDGFIRLFISKTRFNLTVNLENAIRYVQTNLLDEVLSYRSTVESRSALFSAVDVLAGDITITASNAIFNIAVMQTTKASAYTEYKCDVINDTAFNYVNYPVELKVDFDANLVASNDLIYVEDQSGNEIAAQFEQARYCNLRKKAKIGQFADLSFRTGSIWINDTINAGVKKDYVLKLIKQSNSASSTLSATSAGYSLNVGNIKYDFNISNNLLLSAVTIASTAKTFTTFCSAKEVNADASAFASVNFTVEPSLKLISAGPVFSEVEVQVYNAAGARLAAKDLLLTVTYLIFANGKMRISSIMQATKTINVNVLAGYTLTHQLIASSSTKNVPYGSAYMSLADGAVNNPFSFVMTVANGDIHRDGQAYGPSRNGVANWFSPTTNVRTLLGWSIDTLGQYTLVNYNVPKNWTWTTEYWVNFTETQTDAINASKACVNRPVGFLAKTINKYTQREYVYSKMIQAMRGYYNFATSSEAVAQLGGVGKDQKTNYNYPTLYDLSEALIANKSIDDCWTNFVALMNRNFKPEGQANIDLYALYMSNGLSSQYAAYRVIYPIQYFLLFGLKFNKTTIVDTCKLWIGQYADAVVKMVNDQGWFPLRPNITSPSGNANAAGIWILGIAIKAGLDVANKYSNAFTTLENVLTNSADNGRWLPVVMDTMNATESIAKQRWFAYETGIGLMYQTGCELAARTPVFSLVNNFIRLSNGDATALDINACCSESRRGGINSALDTANQAIKLNTKSSANLAYVIARDFEKNAPYDYFSEGERMFDFDPTTSSWNSTSKSIDASRMSSCVIVLNELLDRV